MNILNSLKKVAFVLPLLVLFFAVSCANDDDATAQNFNIAQLEGRIAEAEDLIATSVEGINAGDYQPGSKDALQDVVNWIYKRIESSKSQADIDDAVIKLNAAIDKFKGSTVSVAVPWIQHGNGSGIKLSDNLKQVLFGASTIELQVYIVDLNAFSGTGLNNLLSSEALPNNGMTARYFGDGSLQLVAGTASGWVVAGADPGTLKSGEWLDIAYTNSGSGQKFYVNGTLVATIDGTPAATDVPYIIGNGPTWVDRSSNVVVKEVKVWNSELDQGTILANIGASVDGTESGLEAYFPLGSNLGSSFSDVVGNSTATLEGAVEWVSEPPVIVLNYDNINAAIQELTDFRATVVEGDMDGDYPIGTLDYIDSLLEGANGVLESETRQTALDDAAVNLSAQIDLINANLVGPAEGIYIDSEDPNAVGFRMTPNYTPTGDYTYEFDLKIKTLELPTFGWGDIFGNNTLGLRLNGYQELSEENLLNAGGGWNFTYIEAIANYTGPTYPALTIKSGTWQHIAIVHDDTARTTAIYVDGEMVSLQEDIGVPLNSVWGETWIGNAFGAKINGYVKDFRRWDEVRSVGQLDADIDGTEPNLQTYFPLDRVKGIQFSDETGNYNGEMRGIVWNN
ncbi:LamG domain-containing protein [Tamlana crocina]